MAESPTPRSGSPDPMAAVTSVYRSLIRTRQKVYALEAESELSRQGKRPRMRLQFTSQYGEDLLAWDLLGPQTSGFFIEAGAFDGYFFSVTYPFEAMGWSGLLVEPIPDVARACAQRRPNSRVVNAALGDKQAAGETTFNVVSNEFDRMLSYRTRTQKNQRDSSSLPTQSVRVPLTNLNTLLADHSGPIDLVVLDVEGGEPEVLDGFDLQRFRPRLMFIEAGEETADAIARHMASVGYIGTGPYEGNLVFIRGDESAMLERLSWLHV